MSDGVYFRELPRGSAIVAWSTLALLTAILILRLLPTRARVD